MPQENSPRSAADIRQLFADVLNDNEKLKVRVGQTVVFNDSDVGKPRNRLDAEMLSRIKESVLLDQDDRVDIPLAPKGGPKAPEVEVVGISGKGKEGERILFRQEKGLGISVNEVRDRQRTLTKTSLPEIEEPIAKQGATIAIQSDTIGIQDGTIDSVADQLIEANNLLKSKVEAEKPISSKTIAVFAQRVEALPQSNTKALWHKLSADVRALSQQVRAVTQKNRDVIDTLKKVPSAIKQDAATLINQTQQQLSDIKQSVQTKVAQTSIDDVASMAISGASAVAEVGSQGLGKANLYLQNRADRVKIYGMAKAALRLYNKGHARTGESIFTTNNFTVEAVTNGFKIKDAQDRLMMSFGTDKQGKPISVTKEAALQPEHYKQVNQASKLPVIKGSPVAEASYSQRVSRIVEDLKKVVSEGNMLSGRNFHISRENTQTMLLTTQGIPRRELIADLSNGTHSSTLTMEDLEQVEASIEASASIQRQYAAAEVSTNEPNKSAQVEMV